MKKYLILLVALAMVLGISGIAMAQLDTESIGVSASVSDYAEITLSGDDLLYDLDGSAGDSDTVSLSASIETNCDASVAMSATQLTNGNDVINTVYDVNAGAGSFDPDTVPPTTYTDSTTITGKGTYDYNVTGTATLGAISGQSAGTNYSATVTVTVSAI